MGGLFINFGGMSREVGVWSGIVAVGVLRSLKITDRNSFA